MKVLVTGCAGFIASAVCRLLLEQGHAVHGVDNLNDAYDPRLKAWRIEELESKDGFTWSHADVTDRPALAALFGENQFDAVVNLAARAGVRQSKDNPWIYNETNVVGTLNLLDRCQAHGVKRFILASTSSVYGDEALPFSESAACNRPISPYAASKKAAEELCHSYSHMYDIGVTALRFFTVFGPAGRPDMSIFRFIRWIAEGDELVLLGDGSQRRSFTYVDDIARGVVRSLSLSSQFEVINLGSDQSTELIEVIRRIESAVGAKAIIDQRDPDPLDIYATLADISKARSLLEWQPEVSLAEGIDATVEWYMQNRDRAREIQV